MKRTQAFNVCLQIRYNVRWRVFRKAIMPLPLPQWPRRWLNSVLITLVLKVTTAAHGVLCLFRRIEAQSTPLYEKDNQITMVQ